MGDEVIEMIVSGWATKSIAKTKHVDAELASVGKIHVDASGANDGVSLTGKDAAGRRILIQLSATEIARIISFHTKVPS